MSTQPVSVEKSITLWCNHTTVNGKKLDDGSAVNMSGSNANFFTAYNHLVDELGSSNNYNWTENHTDEDGRFEVANNEYQLTTSCYFLVRGIFTSLTLQLVLDDNTLEPSGISITIDGKNFQHKRHVIEAVYGGGVKDLVDLMENTVRVKLQHADFEASVTKINIKPSNIDTKWIQRSYALAEDAVATDVKVIGFKADNEKSIMILSYKANGVKQVAETSLAHYYSSRH